MDPRSAVPAAHGGPVRALLASLMAEPDAMLDRIAADVREQPERVEVALARHVELTGAISAELAIAEGGQEHGDTARSGPAPVLARLRADGEAAAGAGDRLEHLLDFHLSAGWVIWEAANGDPEAGAGVLAALGTALLRAGDLAAAAIADGFGAAERDRVARRTAVLRGLVHELLDPGAVDAASAARISRSAAAVGIDSGRPHRVVVAWLGEPVDDEDPRVSRISRAVARPPRTGQAADPLPIVMTRRGRIVELDATDRAAEGRLALALAAAGPTGWWAVASQPTARLADFASVAAEAFAILAVAVRLPASGEILTSGALALERALLADEALLKAAVDAELGPLLASQRNGAELVETIAAFLAEGMSVTGTSRRLGLAPRTVTYRLERIEALRGAPLDASAWRRYAVALAGRDLMAGAPGKPTS